MTQFSSLKITSLFIYYRFSIPVFSLADSNEFRTLLILVLFVGPERLKMKKVFLFLLLVLSAYAEFNLQFIGDSLTTDEAEGREFCTSKYCVGDTQILFYAATQNASVHPCTDFKEFSMGTLIKYRALHERYFAIGLLQDTQKHHEERLRKQLAKKIDETKDVRVFKVMRNFHAKCVSSSEFESQG